MIINPFGSIDIIKQLYQKIYEKFIADLIKKSYHDLQTKSHLNITSAINLHCNDYYDGYTRRYDLIADKKENMHFYSQCAVCDSSWLMQCCKYEIYLHTSTLSTVSPFNIDTLPRSCVNISFFDVNLFYYYKGELIEYNLAKNLHRQTKSLIMSLSFVYHFIPEILEFSSIKSNELSFDDYCTQIETLKLENI